MNAPQPVPLATPTSPPLLTGDPSIARVALGLAAALGIGACGGGGGGGGATPITAPVQFAASDVAQEGQQKQVTLALTESIATEFTVRIRDTFEGTAEVGTDYFPFDERDFQFNAGNPAGLEVSVTLDVFDDAVIEGEAETVVLELGLPRADGSVAPLSRQTIRIEDDDFGEVRFITPTVVTNEQDQETFGVGVELLLEPAQTLALPLTVALVSTDAGNATPGEDFLVDVGTIEFQPGGPTASELRFTILDDTKVEGDEGFEFTLLGGPGVLPYSGPTSLFIIAEDDFTMQPSLSLRTGSGLPVGSGAGFDFGSVVPNDTLAGTLTLANTGASAMRLATLRVLGDTRDFRVEMVPPSFSLEGDTDALAGADPGAVPQVTPSGELDAGRLALQSIPTPRETLAFPYRARPADPSAVGPITGQRLALEPLDNARVVEASAGGTSTSLRLEGVPRTDGVPGTLTLLLDPLPLPLAEGAQLAIDGVPVPAHERVAGLELFAGTVEGAERSDVYLAWTSEGPTGWIEHDGVRSHLIPIREAGHETRLELVDDRALHALARTAPEVCAGVLDPPFGALPPSGANGRGATQAPRDASAPDAKALGDDGFQPAKCRIVVETDTAYAQLFPNTDVAAEYLIGLFGAVSQRYRRDAQLDIELVYVTLYTGPDPWSSESASDVEALLLEFQDAWNQMPWPAAGDLAHFISGVDLGGGVAYQNALCVGGYAYGASSAFRGNLDWQAFNGLPSVFNWDYIVVAHELGHGLGARHTHDYCPQLDRCVAGCEAKQCGLGTLMSYCLQCIGGTANVETRLHSENANAVRTMIEPSCLGDGTLAEQWQTGLRIVFQPTSGPGVKNALIRFEHDAPNAPSPFEIAVTGVAE